MTVTQGEVAALAGQAAALLPVRTDVRVEPMTNDDAYRFGRPKWWVHVEPAGGDTVTVAVDSADAPAEALARIVEQLGEHVDGSGRPVLACPGHPHAAQVRIEDDDVLLTCPQSGEVIGRVTPA